MERLDDAPRGSNPRPWVTLSYAQSLDGSIAARRGAPLAISGPEALRLTHELRAAHDAILVGIGTVLADDPQLTVRLAPGHSPQPVVLDARLRFPRTARLLDNARPVWIFTAAPEEAARQARLEARGARVFFVAREADGRVSLPAVLAVLAAQGVRRLMVEGGARVITSFLRAGLVDEVVLTLAPVFVGGLSAVEGGAGRSGALARLEQVSVTPCGEDWIVRGRLAQFS